MSLFDKIAVDLHNVSNHYEQTRLRNLEGFELEQGVQLVSDPDFINTVCRPVILETAELALLLLAPIALPIGYAIGELDREKFTRLSLWHWKNIKHSPIAIIGALALASNHSNTALATLVGAYLVKKILD